MVTENKSLPKLHGKFITLKLINERACEEICALWKHRASCHESGAPPRNDKSQPIGASARRSAQKFACQIHTNCGAEAHVVLCIELQSNWQTLLISHGGRVARARGRKGVEFRAKMQRAPLGMH